MEIKWNNSPPPSGNFTIEIDPTKYGSGKIHFIDFVVDGRAVQICAEIFSPVTEEEMQAALQLARIRYGCGT